MSQSPSLPPQREHVSMRYMTRFRCVGPDCEDTCCAGWTVFLSDRNYKALKKAVSGSKADRELFRASVSRVRDDVHNKGRSGFAVIQMHEDTKQCHWLHGGWCGLQKKYGSEALPDVCNAYPRMHSSTPRAEETAGYLSCPEVARQLLLTDDACDLVSDPEGLNAWRLLIQRLPAAEQRPYFTLLDEVRATFDDVLRQDGLSLVHKLFVLGLLGSRTEEYFCASAAPDPDVPARWRGEVHRMLAPGSLAEAARFIDSQEPKQRFSLLLVSEVLTAIAQLTHSPRFQELVQSTFDHYLELTGQAPASGSDAKPVHLEAVLDRYMTNIRRLRLGGGEHLERIFTNFARYFCFAHWYTASPHLTSYLQRLLLERAFVHFLLAGHRGLHETVVRLVGKDGGQQPSDWTPARREALGHALNAAAVEVFYLTARSYEHGAGITTVLADKIRKAGFETLAGSLFLIKF